MKSRGLRCAWGALALCAMAPVAVAATTVSKVELSAPSTDSARMVLSLSAMPDRKVFAIEKTADKPDRIVIDLTGTRMASGLRLPHAVGPVRAVRSGTQPGKTLRLVIELTRPLNPVVSINGSQLTIDIGAVPAQFVAAPAPSPAPASASSPASPPAPVRAAHAPEDTGRDVIVAVDAGHGGDDPGASGANGTKEKDVVFAIALALAKRIDAEPGMRAYLTRRNDRKIELRERIGLASRAHADFFVSIHADAFKNRDVAGSSVYVLSERGASSEAARLLAEQENLKGGISKADNEDQLAAVLMDLSQGASKAASMEAAERMLSQLDRVGTVRKTKVQQAGFAVLKLPDIPSMLVETAYITNPGEEKKLRDPAHQAALAEAIFNGVREHLRTSPPDGTLFARQRARSGIAPIIAGSTGP
ncbi:MAG: N-acetylmuramoyl-L-alanine amidase [Steroidobacteraceae bacterium]